MAKELSKESLERMCCEFEELVYSIQTIGIINDDLEEYLSTGNKVEFDPYQGIELECSSKDVRLNLVWLENVSSLRIIYKGKTEQIKEKIDKLTNDEKFESYLNKILRELKNYFYRAQRSTNNPEVIEIETRCSVNPKKSLKTIRNLIKILMWQ